MDNEVLGFAKPIAVGVASRGSRCEGRCGSVLVRTSMHEVSVRHMSKQAVQVETSKAD